MSVDANLVDLFDETSDDPRAWHRQRDESPKAYAAFRAYLELGEQRGVQRVATQLSKSRTLCSRWASRHHWKERACGYDDFLADVQMRAFISDRQAMGALLGQRIAITGLLALHEQLQTKGRLRGLTVHKSVRLFEACSKIERINCGEPDQDQVASIQVTITQQTRPRSRRERKRRSPPNSVTTQSW